MPNPVPSLAASCLFLAAGACSGPLPVRLLGPDRPQTAGPFDPVALRIHPLTHIERGGPGVGPDECLLILHLELSDAYADPVKGLGSLTVELFRPGAGPTPGMESQSRRWAVPNFSDPPANSARFDPATRTYRVPLVVEAWVFDWLDPANAPLRNGAPAWVKVRAVLETADAAGAPLLLADEFIVQR
ncbi:MAG: hypothetical protein SFY69_06105 [Planctomycetota bacterium]|nr:hypothetical protein [Planctomycetota bacterium]